MSRLAVGDVRTAMIKMDNGRSRGMGTVSFYTAEDARRAVRILDSAANCVLSLVVSRDRTSVFLAPGLWDFILFRTGAFYPVDAQRLQHKSRYRLNSV